MRGRRILPTNDDDEEAELFQMGEDEDFEGLRPDRDVGEHDLEPAATGEDVVLEPVIRLNRARRGARGGRGRVDRAAIGRGDKPNTVQAEEPETSLGSEDEVVEEELLNRQLGGRRRPIATAAAQEQRIVEDLMHKGILKATKIQARKKMIASRSIQHQEHLEVHRTNTYIER